jgi:acid phosphatase
MRIAPLALAVAVLAGGPARSATSSIPPLVIVFMENHSEESVLADPVDMPYLNSLWANQLDEQFPHYYAVGHPSFPNYSAMASGQVAAPADAVTAGEFSDPTLWDQLTSAGISWGVYEESMPGTCSKTTYYNDTTGSSPGPYKIGHNPAVPFSDVYGSAECRNVLPFSAMKPSALPQVSFVAPNLCDDMHGVASTDPNGYASCVTGSTAIDRRGDSWLAAHVPAWTAAGADVFITFDEGSGYGNQVYAVLTGPHVTGGTDTATLNHYSLLAGIEDAYRLPLLGSAASATPIQLPQLVNSVPPTSCPPPAAGTVEESGNVSIESSQSGWTGVYNSQSAVTRVEPAGGSYDGRWALRVGLQSGHAGTAGVNNVKPTWVTSSVAGDSYTGSVFVRATAGDEVSLMVRETTQSGAGGIGYHTSTMTLHDGGWHQLTSEYTAKKNGDQIRYTLYASNLTSGQSVLADCLSLRAS